MHKLQAVLFDLDGTLIDSEHYHYELWMELLEKYGHTMAYTTWKHNYAGKTAQYNAQEIHRIYHLPINLQELIIIREQMSFEGFKTHKMAMMPYATEALQYFKQAGIKLALVTASPRQDVELIFEKNNLTHYFNTIVTRTDVLESKPDPECYNLAVKQLNVPKEACVVFEDTVNGTRAAKAAHLTCYAIQADEDEHAQLSIADDIFSNLQEAVEALTGVVLAENKAALQQG